MTTEMDLLQMDERQRLAWLMANRGTLMAVGAAWIGLIVWELTNGRSPLFLILMVPLFALLRAGLFFYYCALPVDLGARRLGGRLGLLAKVCAGSLLALALLLPLYSLGPAQGAGAGAGRRYGFTWQLVHDDWAMVFPLLVAFLWPVAVLLLFRLTANRRLSYVIQVAEPLLAALSVLIVLWIPQLVWELRTIFVFVIGLESARPEAGCYLAVAANGVYFVTWLSEALRPGVKRSARRDDS